MDLNERLKKLKEGKGEIAAKVEKVNACRERTRKAKIALVEAQIEEKAAREALKKAREKAK